VPRLRPALLERVVRHVERDLPREACGLLLARAGDPDVTTEAIPVHNATPARADASFRLADDVLLKTLLSARREGQVVRVIYHSHVDLPASFSPTDEQGALWFGQPRFPGVDHLVLGTQGGRVVDLALFRWDAGVRHFRRHDLCLPPRGGGATESTL
jgi:proteasome lid subunit RPN8/RPN11